MSGADVEAFSGGAVGLEAAQAFDAVLDAGDEVEEAVTKRRLDALVDRGRGQAGGAAVAIERSISLVILMFTPLVMYLI